MTTQQTLQNTSSSFKSNFFVENEAIALKSNDDEVRKFQIPYVNK